MITKQELIKKYFDALLQEGLLSSRSSSAKNKLQFWLERLFKDMSFKGKTMLDIGGGSGIISFYSACLGAKEVVCLEPEAAGSRSGVLEKFRRLHTRLQLSQVGLEPTTLQSFDPAGRKFDIVLLHNSVNHLDETACISLLKDENSSEIYKSIFSKIYSLSNSGAGLIVCDCSRYNFFALLRIINPFAPSIEWHKHQSPKVWAQLLSEVGYCNPEINWNAPSDLRSPGALLLGNKYLSYFLTSHFCLRMEKPSG